MDWPKLLFGNRCVRFVADIFVSVVVSIFCPPSFGEAIIIAGFAGVLLLMVFPPMKALIFAPFVLVSLYGLVKRRFEKTCDLNGMRSPRECANVSPGSRTPVFAVKIFRSTALLHRDEGAHHPIQRLDTTNRHCLGPPQTIFRMSSNTSSHPA